MKHLSLTLSIGAILLSSIACTYAAISLYGSGGTVSSVLAGQQFTAGTSIGADISTTSGSTYRAYACLASVSPAGLTGNSLDQFFVDNAASCTLAYSGVANSASTHIAISGLAIGNYQLHIIDGCTTIVPDATPVATLVGSGTMTLTVGDTYSESGATWTDAEDGSGTISVASSGTVNTAIPGAYTLTYSYTDTASHMSNIVTRTVTVVKACIANPQPGDIFQVVNTSQVLMRGDYSWIDNMNSYASVGIYSLYFISYDGTDSTMELHDAMGALSTGADNSILCELVSISSN